jgi:hypothetical protein
MLLNILLATKAVLLLNSGFMGNPNSIPYDTLEIRDANFNAYLYISESNYYEITENTYEIIPVNEDSLIFRFTTTIGDEELEPYSGDIIIDPNYDRRVNAQGDTIYVSLN